MIPKVWLDPIFGLLLKRNFLIIVFNHCIKWVVKLLFNLASFNVEAYSSFLQMIHKYEKQKSKKKTIRSTHSWQSTIFRLQWDKIQRNEKEVSESQIIFCLSKRTKFVILFRKYSILKLSNLLLSLIIHSCLRSLSFMIAR